MCVLSHEEKTTTAAAYRLIYSSIWESTVQSQDQVIHDYLYCGIRDEDQWRFANIFSDSAFLEWPDKWKMCWVHVWIMRGGGETTTKKPLEITFLFGKNTLYINVFNNRYRSLYKIPVFYILWHCCGSFVVFFFFLDINLQQRKRSGQIIMHVLFLHVWTCPCK